MYTTTQTYSSNFFPPRTRIEERKLEIFIEEINTIRNGLNHTLAPSSREKIVEKIKEQYKLVEIETMACLKKITSISDSEKLAAELLRFVEWQTKFIENQGNYSKNPLQKTKQELKKVVEQNFSSFLAIVDEKQKLEKLDELRTTYGDWLSEDLTDRITSICEKLANKHSDAMLQFSLDF